MCNDSNDYTCSIKAIFEIYNQHENVLLITKMYVFKRKILVAHNCSIECNMHRVFFVQFLISLHTFLLMSIDYNGILSNTQQLVFTACYTFLQFLQLRAKYEEDLILFDSKSWFLFSSNETMVKYVRSDWNNKEFVLRTTLKIVIFEDLWKDL